MFYPPQKLNLQFEEFYIAQDDKVSLHAWYFPSEVQPAKGTVVFFHGNAENLTSHYLALHWLPKEGYNYIIFDYPGYNLSTGSPTPESTVLAGKTTVEWTIKNKPADKYYLLGHSLGGIVALRTLEELPTQSLQKIKGVVIDGSFSSYQKVSRSVLNKHWLTWPLQPLTYLLISDEWAPKKLSEQRKIPFMIIHSQKDPVIEFDLGEHLFNQLNDQKVFLPVPEPGHGNVFFIENGKYRNDLLQFFSQN